MLNFFRYYNNGLFLFELQRAMEGEKFYNNIQKAFENLPENFNILEDRIDIEIQMKFFEYAKEIKQKNIADDCFEKRDELFENQVSDERKKEILSAIAGLDEVKAYRTIEKFIEVAEEELKQWAIMALQESRMLIQSSLLDEQQIFISTGLGGKGKKLRYYVVFISRDEESMLNKTQQKLLKNELIFELKNSDGEFESMDYMEGFSSAMVMLPISANIKDVFQSVVDECNQYGGFLQDNLIVTNVKVLSRGEIIQMLKNKETDTIDELEEE